VLLSELGGGNCLPGYAPGREVANARHPRALRTFLKFAIKTGYVLDPWKTFCFPWVFSGVLESSWTGAKLFIFELLITLNIQETRLSNVIEQHNVYICSILNSCVAKSNLFKKICVTTMRATQLGYI